jgi:EAL domain-containing protein (putative c-di-GMP-specific phosphodiesterase class I)
MEEIFGTVFKALYHITDEFRSFVEEEKAKVAIIDELKEVYNYVSDEFYNYRYEVFQKNLKNIEMFFEPIFFFDKGQKIFTIWGWEALARNKTTKKTPVDLFNVAELWGLKFQTELDLCCLRNAIEAYSLENKRLKKFRYGETRPLSVNVFPNTILRTTYRALLDELLNSQGLISKGKLILEISEKTLIQSKDIKHEEAYLKDFSREMRSLRAKYKINFAIDDFGVGNSSLSRLNKLLPAYVKIDREILQYDPSLGKGIIRYVKELADSFHGKGIEIIVEGVDDESRIPLPKLINDLEVEYLQGHKFSSARPTITDRLEKEIYTDIVKILGWPIPV